MSSPTRRSCARLAAEAEEAGWHGFFVWDQLRWKAPVRQVADPWITLAAIATATERLRLGPMVTPLPRRRPVKVARETATLDWLSGGRLTLGVGIGGDSFAASSRRPASSSTNGPGPDARRGTGDPHRRLELVSRFTTTATTTRSTTSSSSPGRCSDPASRYGSRGSPATSSRCGEPPDTTASSPPTSSTPTNSPRSSPSSPSCATTRPHLRHRRRPPRRRRSRAVRRGRCHVVAPGVRSRGAVAGRRAGPAPSRTLRTVSPADVPRRRPLRRRTAPVQPALPHRGGGGASGRSRARRRLRYRSDHA